MNQLSLNFFLFDVEKYTPLEVAHFGGKVTGEYRLKGQDIVGWQRILAEARSRFLHDLIQTNSLSVGGDKPKVIEIDDGVSLLGPISRKYGLNTITHDSTSFDQIDGTFDVGVSHTLLEHLQNVVQVTRLLDSMAEHSLSMVHQVHESDSPGFAWDSSHTVALTRKEWDIIFSNWAIENQGWTYLGYHQGLNGRPANYVFEKDGSLPFYRHYDKKFTRRLLNEFTAANAISLSRIPLLLTSFAIAKDNPPLLSALLTLVYALDGADGYVARKGLGNSPWGAHVDILSDHIVELITVFEFAYDMKIIPQQVPWILASRDVVTDFMRLYNAVVISGTDDDSHPHTSFGTFDRAGRFLSSSVKVAEAVTVPIVPSLGLTLSTAHVLTSLYRGFPVVSSPT